MQEPSHMSLRLAIKGQVCKIVCIQGSRSSDPKTPPSPCSFFFFSSRRRHTRLQGDWSSDVCSSDLSAVRLVTTPFTGAVTVVYCRFSFAASSSAFFCSTKAKADCARERVAATCWGQIGRASCRERV